MSPGCDNCYAARLTSGRLAHQPLYAGLAANGRFTGEVRLVPERLEVALRWRKPRMIFVNSMSDLFHDDVPDDFIARVFAVMAATPRHTYQVLTKRHARMRSLLNSWPFALVVQEAWDVLSDDHGLYDVTPPTVGRWPLPNVWLGVSVENQKWADIRIPALLDTPAAVRFLSCEPLLGPVDLRTKIGPQCPWCGCHIAPTTNEEYREDEPRWRERNPMRCPECGGVGGPEDWNPPAGQGIDWVIVGGESGPPAPDGPGIRPMQALCQIMTYYLT